MIAKIPSSRPLHVVLTRVDQERASYDEPQSTCRAIDLRMLFDLGGPSCSKALYEAYRVSCARLFCSWEGFALFRTSGLTFC